MAALSLEIVEGPGAGRQLPLGEPLVLGRAQDAHLVLQDPQVSRHHARITPRGERAVVEDLGSSNGTFVNGAELHAPATVGPGDDILVGITVVELRSLAQIAAQPSAVRPVPQAIAAEAPSAPQGPPPPAPPAVQRPPGAPAPPPQAAPGFAAAPLSAPGAPEGPGEELARLLDARTKRRAQTAPLALFVLVVLVLLVYFAVR
jgi:pSer/pThr/pTyr-binding forkhead associated (FHA) protein